MSDDDWINNPPKGPYMKPLSEKATRRAEVEDEARQKTANFLRKIFKNGVSKKVGSFRREPFYEFVKENHTYTFMYSEELDEVIFFSEAHTIPNTYLPKTGRQVMVWKHALSEEASGFASDLLLKRYLKKYGVIAADTLQSKDGSRYWQSLMLKSLTKNLFVYAFDGRQRAPWLKQLHDKNDLIWASKILWGNSKEFESTYALISLKEIELNFD